MATLKYSPNVQCLFLENDTRELCFYKGLFSSRDCILHDRSWNKSLTRQILDMFGKSEICKERFFEDKTIAENVNPYICLINYNLVVYFGEDKPILKSKSVKSCTDGYKTWTLNNWKNPQKKETYYYLDVKESDKLFIFGNTYDFEIMSNENKQETLEVVDGQYICKFDMSNEQWEKQMQVKIQKDIEEKKRREEEAAERERRKNTPGYCSCCGSENAMFTVNPYNADMYGDYTQIWLCDNCYDSLLGDI